MFAQRDLIAAAVCASFIFSAQSIADARKHSTKDAAPQAGLLGPQSTYCRSVEAQIEKECLADFTWDEATVLVAVNAEGEIVDSSNAKSEDQTKALQSIKALKKLAAPPVGCKNPYWFRIETGNSAEKVAVAARDVDYSPYLMALQKKIRRNWSPPHGLQSNQVKVSFVVFYDGHIEKLKISESDGLKKYEQAALAATEQAVPFKPLPDGSSENIKIEFNLAYNVNSGKSDGAEQS